MVVVPDNHMRMRCEKFNGGGGIIDSWGLGTIKTCKICVEGGGSFSKSWNGFAALLVQTVHVCAPHVRKRILVVQEHLQKQ